ncbi:MAG: ABC transporter ATP-binding protein [Rhodospirillaceae bacterium]|nr:ABC transporter ATP-binding protein [Rhodospirillaceae bacterium]
MAPVLRIEDVEVYYDGVIHVLKGVSLEIPEKGIVALLGANGAGKSTTLKAVSNLLRAERGEVARGAIEFLGRSIVKLDPADIVRLGIVQVLEGRRLFEHLTVEENLRARAYAQAWGESVRNGLERVYEYFPNLAERRELKAGYLSGGEQQMTAIGRALMGRPKLILLDEPSMGLAPLLVKEIFQIVHRLNREEDVAILLAEQNALMALSIVQYAYVMEGGRIVSQGPAEELARDDSVRRFYLGMADHEEHQSYRKILEEKRAAAGVRSPHEHHSRGGSDDS